MAIHVSLSSISMSPVSGDLYERSYIEERPTIFFVNLVSMLPPRIQVHEGRGQVVVKSADGKSHRVARRKVSLPYTFDGFRSDDDF